MKLAEYRKSSASAFPYFASFIPATVMFLILMDFNTLVFWVRLKKHTIGMLSRESLQYFTMAGKIKLPP